MSRVLDILEAMGATPVPVTFGEGGPDLGQLAAALRGRPSAFVYQPVGSHPCGTSVSADWIDKAANLLRDVRMPIIELVQTPLLHTENWRSLGRLLPHAVVHIHAYNFFFGSDLRVGVAGGSDYYIDRMWQQLTFSSRWTSRILQDALAFQLSDPGALAELDRFVATCRQRQRTFTKALRRVGFDVPDNSGPTIWLPVPDEYVMTTQMSSRGVVVHPGSYFSTVPLDRQHVLMNGTTLAQGQDEMALTLARVAGLAR